MEFLWKFLGNLIAGPIVGAVVDGYKAKLAAGTSETTLAEKLTERELAVQQRELEAQSAEKIALMGHPFAVENLFAYVTLIFYAKVLVWDKVLQSVTHGNTDEVHGAAAVWAGMVITFYFGKRSVAAALQFWSARRK